MMDSRVSARTLETLLGPWRTREPAYEAIADSVRLLCLDNRIAPRTALPAERELAARLGVSRTTVAAAYRSLRDSGHIESHRGSGSVTVPLGGSVPGGFPSAEGVLDLQQASPSAWPGLAGAYADAAANAASLVSRTGYDVVGRPGLREAIAAHYAARGLPDVRLSDHGHERRAERDRPRGVAVRLQSRPGRHRDADLSARRRSLPATGSDGWSACRWSAVTAGTSSGPSTPFGERCRAPPT